MRSSRRWQDWHVGREIRVSKEVVSESTCSRELRVQLVCELGRSGSSMVSSHRMLGSKQVGDATCPAGSGGRGRSARITWDSRGSAGAGSLHELVFLLGKSLVLGRQQIPFFGRQGERSPACGPGGP